jgi:Ni,Fe-hydrogenase I small subunit
MSFLNADEPTACDLVADFGINILWHPSLGLELGSNLKTLLWECITGKIPLDILVFEGSVVNAPNGTGEWNSFVKITKNPYNSYAIRLRFLVCHSFLLCESCQITSNRVKIFQIVSLI